MPHFPAGPGRARGGPGGAVLGAGRVRPGGKGNRGGLGGVVPARDLGAGPRQREGGADADARIDRHHRAGHRGTRVGAGAMASSAARLGPVGPGRAQPPVRHRGTRRTTRASTRSRRATRNVCRSPVTGKLSRPRPQLPDRKARPAGSQPGRAPASSRPRLAPTACRSSRSASAAQAPTRSVKPRRTAVRAQDEVAVCDQLRP